MDGSLFDTWTRRRFGLAMGGVAVALVELVSPDSANAKKKKKKKCKGGKKKCGKKCILKTECCGGCDEGLTCCDGACRDLTTDVANCGACGRACEGAACVHGACGCTDEADCPDLCACRTSVEGGLACAAKPSEPFVECNGDDDCPLGAICFDNGVIQICTGVCQG